MEWRRDEWSQSGFLSVIVVSYFIGSGFFCCASFDRLIDGCPSSSFFPCCLPFACFVIGSDFLPAKVREEGNTNNDNFNLCGTWQCTGLLWNIPGRQQG